MFQSFFFFLHRDDCFGSVPSDVSPAACSTTTSIYWEHPLWLCPRRTHTSFRVHHTVSLAALYPDLPSSTQLFRLWACNTLKLQISPHSYCSMSPREWKEESGWKEVGKTLRCNHKNGWDLPHVWAWTLQNNPDVSASHFSFYNENIFWTSHYLQILAAASLDVYLCHGVRWSKSDQRIDPQRLQLWAPPIQFPLLSVRPFMFAPLYTHFLY